MKKTKKDYEKHLNMYYSEFPLKKTKDALIYLTVPARGKHITEKQLQKAWSNFTLGKIVRKYDPIAFNVGFNEWQKP